MMILQGRTKQSAWLALDIIFQNLTLPKIFSIYFRPASRRL